MEPLCVLPMRQAELFPEAGAIRTAVIARRADFDALFEGFTALRAVSYVVSPELLLGFFERGYERLEIVVGENMADAYRQQLAERGAEVAEKLAARVASGALRLLLPDRTLHTKLYLLGGPQGARVVQTSANLTETARGASKQVNYAWYLDVKADSPFLRKIEEDYAAHARRCVLFMGDLAELMKAQGENSRRELVEAWLRGVAAEDVEHETRKLMQELAARALEPAAAVEGLITLRLPEAPAARRQAERLLAPLGATASGGELRVAGPGFLRYVQSAHGLPLLRVDLERREARLAIDGQIIRLDEEPPAPAVVGEHLERLERYFATVDHGRSPEPGLAKMSMFEALLGLWSAPFAHEFMRAKRRFFGAIDSRGPRFLYIYGPSQNGKSTFLKLGLRLMTGRAVEPLSGADFGKRKIAGAASIGTAFPLVFDDLVMASKAGAFEDVLKSYWESWWREDCASPQIVLSSNAYSLPGWAKSRVRRLDFDVHFAPSSAGREALARAFAEENRTFRWFARLLLERLARGGTPPEDELAWAREAMAGLYAKAARTLPPYFPAKPVESLYDPGRKAWRELLDRLGKARIEADGERALVHFAEDVQFFEIREYEGHLPPQIKHRRRGKTLIVESPRELREWLEGPGGAKSVWRRLGDWLGAGRG
ncbi:MAG: phospholipase D family protein [Elusimicrobia bacterium]|nr:phospholipase D family protein [Elusimicrobiota bacterium]